MNKNTTDIMKFLKVDTETAMEVQDRMASNGIDFSECTTKEFKAYAREAFDEMAAELV